MKTDQGFLLRGNRRDLKKVKVEEPSGSILLYGSMGEQELSEETTSEETSASPASCQKELRRLSRQVKPPDRLIESMLVYVHSYK